MTPAAIRTLRQSQKLTQAKFAALLGCRQATISNWESGRQAPSPLALNALTLLQHAQDMAEDLECMARGHTWGELCACPSEPALVMWRKFVRERSDL